MKKTALVLLAAAALAVGLTSAVPQLERSSVAVAATPGPAGANKTIVPSPCPSGAASSLAISASNSGSTDVYWVCSGTGSIYGAHVLTPR